MKYLRGLNILLFLLVAIGMNAQSDFQTTERKEVKVQKYTVMEKFEPDYVIPVDERKRLKFERREMVAHRRSILDTLNISDRRRSRLLRELNKNPFSDKVNRKFAEIEFVDDHPDLVDQNK